MTEIERIRDLFHRAMYGQAWHGPALWPLLSDITAEQAAARPLPNVHTIWALVLHITTWQITVRRRLLGENHSPSESQNFPSSYEVSPEAWQRTCHALKQSHEALAAVLADLTIDLDESPTGSTFPAYALIHGTIQHNLYHAGQIAILKKSFEPA